MTAKRGRRNAQVEREPVEAATKTASESLQAARRAFEAGDYRRVRELVSEIERSGDPEESRQARELLGRVVVDPVLLVSLLVFAALFLGIAYTYVFR